MFVAPDGLTLSQFGVTLRIAGPDGIPEGEFTAALDRMGIAYRTVDAGLIHAVIPAHPVSPEEVLS